MKLRLALPVVLGMDPPVSVAPMPSGQPLEQPAQGLLINSTYT